MVAMIRSDLDFILAQIKIAEADAAGVDLLQSGLIPNSELPWGLRRVDGSNNNLLPGQDRYGSADQPFTTALDGGTPTNEADDGMRFGPPISVAGVPIDFGFLKDPTQPLSATNPALPHGYIPSYAVFQGLGGTLTAAGFTTTSGVFIPAANFQANYLTNNDYGIHDPNRPGVADPRALQPGDVVDADPRLISNLIADQSLNNPAAIAAALKFHGLTDTAAASALQAIIAARDIYGTGATPDAAFVDLQTALATAETDAANNSVAAALATATANVTQTRSDLAAANTTLATANSTLASASATVATTAAALASAQAAATSAAATLTAAANAWLAEIDPTQNTSAEHAARAAFADILVMSFTGPVIPTLAEINALRDAWLSEASTVLDPLNPTPDEIVAFSPAEALAWAAFQNAITADGAAALALTAASGASAAAVTALGTAQGNVTTASGEVARLQDLLDDQQTEVASLTAELPIEQARLDGLVADAQAAVDAANLPAILASYEIELTSDGSVFIPNVAPDAGLSAPFNGWMTLFGQFFDHGLDLVGKGGFGTVYIPLQPDDPLYNPLTPNSNFMALTRSTLENGEAINKVTPFVDQNQTYTSHASAQVFHRAYETRDGVTVATGGLLNGAAGGLATWADVKAQAIEMLGIRLSDSNVHSIPLLATDPYGKFIPGANGFAQVVFEVKIFNGGTTPVRTVKVQVEGDPANGGLDINNPNFLPPGVTLADGETFQTSFVPTGHAFLDDIAHHANPGKYDANPDPRFYTAADQTADTDQLDFNRSGASDADDLFGSTVNASGVTVATGLDTDLDGVIDADDQAALAQRGINITLNGGIFDSNDDGLTTVADLEDVNLDGVINAADTFADDRNPTTYDNEMLDRHFITGDGRGNENIGLTAVHHVFHAEHNRQIDLIKATLIADATDLLAGSATDAAALEFLNEWLADGHKINTQAEFDAAVLAGSFQWNGDRLFQAAKIPTEMQYQHLVFEEFARTVQPFVNVFNDYDGQLNAAIVGEFAHTVYRFGHSMLNESVDRLTPDNQSTIGEGGVIGGEQIGLIEAFLNPVEFNAGGMSAEESAGAIARGMTRQRGNEIDEFVTDALRNNLVGLPLDLAALNIARGRETNVPTLNEARAQFYAGSSDAQVKPYASWAEFALNLKNPASIVNFIAAYGTHSTITSATTMAAKRDAAMDLVFGGNTAITETDRLNFLNARGDYAGGTLGGLNNVDFWIGGLAEKQMPFGGMLGTTFNFVFEVQMESLQDGDRFYYLSRLANLNLTAQLENNKFAEMIERNTDAKHLPGNVFKAMDYQLEVDITQQLGADPTGSANGLDSTLVAINGDKKVIRIDVDNDGDTDVLQFIGGEHVVLGGTVENDTLIGDEGDDTLWGDEGDDRLEGGIGNDFTFGGAGNDIITDQFGDDEIRAGAGDDVVGAGQGINLIITDTGNDFVWMGMDTDEALLGQGNDFGAGGAGEDMIIGGEGNDWIESGTENSLLLGDNGDLIQGLPIKRSVDSPLIGHDVLLATGGNADFDAESGDDIMVGGLGTDRFFGAFGFDWATYKDDPYGIEADMNNRQFSPPSIAASPGALLDRYAQTEALSGSRNTDFLRGDDGGTVPGAEAEVATATATLDDTLKDANVALIDGLDEFLGSIDEAGETRFSAGNILLGGGGSDIIEGRGGNDLLDGDRWLDVRIKVVHDGVTEYYNGMGERAIGAPDTAPTLQERMFSGEVPVSALSIDRRITTDGVYSAANGTALHTWDVAQFSGARSDYDVQTDAATGITTVTHLVFDADGAVIPGEIGADGVDRLTNIERILFSDQTIALTTAANSAVVAAGNNSIATGRVAIETVTNTTTGLTTLTASLGTGATAVSDADNVAGIDQKLVQFFWQVELEPGSGVYTNINRIIADEFAPEMGVRDADGRSSYTLTAAEAGLNVRVLARFKDDEGAVETVVSPSTGAGDVGGVPVFNEDLAILGPNLGGLPTPDGAPPLAANSFGIFEDTGPFTFTLQNLLFARDGTSLVTGGAGPITIQPGSVTVRDRDGTGLIGSVVEANVADPWVINGLANLAKQFQFVPVENFNGGVTIEYILTDSLNETVPAEAALTVFAVNDAAVNPNALVGTTPAGTGAVPVTFTLAQIFGATPTDANGRPLDVDGDRLALVDPDAVTSPTGTVTYNAGNDTFTWTPTAGTIFAQLSDIVLNFQIDDGSAATNGTAIINATARIDAVNIAAAGSVTINDATPTVGQTLTAAPLGIADANGLTPLGFQWQSSSDNGATWTNIAAATAATFTVTAAQDGLQLRATTTFTDRGGTAESVVSGATAAVVPNSAPTGVPTLSDVGPTQGVQLSASTLGLADFDGIVGPFTYQWQRSATSDFSGAVVTVGVNATYTPGLVDAGQYLRVVVNYIDGAGKLESVTSAASARMVGTNQAGTNGNNTLTGNAGDDLLNGSGGNDIVNGAGGDDNITYNVTPNFFGALTSGRDTIDGGANDTAGDRFTLAGNLTAETFRFFSNRDDWDNNASNGIQSSAARAGLTSTAEIVVTRNGTFNAATGVFTGGNVLAELSNIEEITVGGAAQTQPLPGTPTGGDSVQIIGNFLNTSLDFNTITISGAGQIDISTLDSRHRIVVNTIGPVEIIGTLRPQDVIVLPNGATVLSSSTSNGLTTLTTSVGAITFNGTTSHILPFGTPVPEDTQDSATSDPVVTADVVPSPDGGPVTTTLPSVLFAGTSNNDALFGDAARNNLVGDAGNDTIFADVGDDNIVAGDGDDEVFAGTGHDVITGGAGKDFVFGEAGDDVILGGVGDDVIDGGADNDRVWGGEGRDAISGGAGNDVIFAMSGDGDDIIDGDDGIDTINYEAARTDTTFDLIKGLVASSDTGNDAVTNVENVMGGRGNDTFYANDLDNVLNGGAGNDTFVFKTAAGADGDTIEGFHAGDRIVLKDIFGGSDPTVVDGAFTAAGQIRLTHEANGDTLIEGSTGADANEDFSILVKAYHLKPDLT